MLSDFQGRSKGVSIQIIVKMNLVFFKVMNLLNQKTIGMDVKVKFTTTCVRNVHETYV